MVGGLTAKKITQVLGGSERMYEVTPGVTLKERLSTVTAKITFL